MDINDRIGDGAAGLHTFPVILGVHGALGVAATCMLCGTAIGTAALVAKCLESPPGFGLIARCAAGVMFVFSSVLHVAIDVQNIMESEFDFGVVSDAIAHSFGPIGAGMILLAICL
jgi:4-hydroxybenzoate polyprenyltransferase